MTAIFGLIVCALIYAALSVMDIIVFYTYCFIFLKFAKKTFPFMRREGIKFHFLLFFKKGLREWHLKTSLNKNCVKR